MATVRAVMSAMSGGGVGAARPLATRQHPTPTPTRVSTRRALPFRRTSTGRPARLGAPLIAWSKEGPDCHRPDMASTMKAASTVRQQTIPNLESTMKKCLTRNTRCLVVYPAYALLGGAVLLLSGCMTTTTPLRASEAKAAPTTRLLAYQTKSPSASGTLVVTRDTGFMGGGCFYAVWINGILSARLDVGERSEFYVQPGDILFRTGRDPAGIGLCNLGQDNWTQRESQIRENETKYFRLLLDANGKSDIQRAD